MSRARPFGSTALALTLLAVAALLAAACQSPGSGPPLAGRVVWPKDGDLWALNLADLKQTRLTQLPSGAAVTSAAWSPDGQRVAYAQFGRRPGDTISGADLLVAGADGSNPTLLVDRGSAGGIVEAPFWARSGALYYGVRRTQNNREQLAVYRVLPGSQPSVVAENGTSPAPTPDESTLLFLRSTRTGQALVRKALTGAGAGDGAECDLLADTTFPILGQPRVSPDGTRVAFSASGNPGPAAGTCPRATGSPAASASRVLADAILHLGLLSGLVPEAAYAHGAPWDLWAINLDGSGLTKLATLSEDEPTVAWSPDGTRLAVFGTAALYVVDAKGGEPRKIVEGGGYGGLDWTR